MNLKLILKSFIIGMAKIIPGVSGSMLAITLGIYEDIIGAITNFFSNPKKNLKLLINFSIGLFLALILFSKLLLFLINNYYYLTMSLFIGLIIGTVFRFAKNVKITKNNIIIFIPIFILTISLSLINTNLTYIFKPNILNYLYIALLGFIDALSSIVPGISGTAIFMLLGSYTFVLEIFTKPFSALFIIYILGVLLGVIIISYLMNYLLKNYREKTYVLILAFSFGSIVLILIPLFNAFKLYMFLILLMGVILGYIFAN